MTLFGDLFERAYDKIKEFHYVQISRTDLDGNVSTHSASFTFQAGAVDEKERALFRVPNDGTAWRRGDFITYDGDQWDVVDVRPDEIGIELRCDKPEVTA